MNPMGCSFLILAAAALVFGFIPILAWTNLFVALPLALISIGMSAVAARKPHAQPADQALLWISAGLGAIIVLRLLAL